MPPETRNPPPPPRQVVDSLTCTVFLRTALEGDSQGRALMRGGNPRRFSPPSLFFFSFRGWYIGTHTLLTISLLSVGCLFFPQADLIAAQFNPGFTGKNITYAYFFSSLPVGVEHTGMWYAKADGWSFHLPQPQASERYPMMTTNEQTTCGQIKDF